MRNLWREVGIAALVCGSLTACASPAYPISEDQPPGPAPMRMARPAYPIAEQAPAALAVRPQPPAAATDDAEPAEAPLAAPVSPVESQPLPAPGASASSLNGARSDGARLQYASLSTQGAAAAPTTAAHVSTAPTSAPVSTALPPAAPGPAADPGAALNASVSTTVAPTSTTPAPPAPATAAEPALTPQMVVHDQQTPPPTARGPSPVREAAATAPDRALNGSVGNVGDVVDAAGGIFENYEVQRGDHIDALARAFSTSRRRNQARAGRRHPPCLHGRSADHRGRIRRNAADP